MDRTVIDPLSCSGIDWAAFLILDISNTVIEAIPTGVVSSFLPLALNRPLP
jgi:hypothetical protein